MADAGGKTLVAKKGGSGAGCPIVRDFIGDGTPLNDILDEMQTDLETIPVTHSGRPIDLSGAGETVIVFVADRAYTIAAAYLVYIEGSSADAGINVKMGKLIVGTDDDDYFITAVATEISKEAGYRKSLTLAQTAIVEGDVITFNSAGSKTGVGTVVLQLYLTKT